jgi:pSer/pThr/pTyr-binding forkhead associated (FHA) protein
MDVNLVLFKKNRTRKSFRLPSSVTVIGRRQECDLCVPLMIVSRRHCEIYETNGKMHIRDMGSRNGTYVNGQQVEQAQLNPGDTIGIGPLKFVIQIDGKPEQLASDDYIMQPPDSIKDENNVVRNAEQFADYQAPNMDQTFSESQMLNNINDQSSTGS